MSALSRRTATTTRGLAQRLPETDGAKVLPTSDQRSDELLPRRHSPDGATRAQSTHPIKQQRERLTCEYAATSLRESFSEQTVGQLVEVELEHIGDVVDGQILQFFDVII